MGKKVFVGNLAFATTGADLGSLFESVGTVESATVVTDRDTGRSRGFGFVEETPVTMDCGDKTCPRNIGHRRIGP